MSERTFLIDEVKSVHRSFPTGVTIVTTTVDGKFYGLAVNAFSSVSLEPPMIMVCVAGSSSTYPHLYRNDSLAVNLLAADQEHVALQFSRKGVDKFEGIDWASAENGAPVLSESCGYFGLQIVGRIPAGTHTIFVGRVTEAKSYDRPPLIYMDAAFFDGSALLRPEEAR